MKIEIITTGNEILKGLTADTNFYWSAGLLNSYGLSLDYHTSVKDNPVDLVNVFSHAIKRADFVIVTGGLGPTDDDLTAKVAADFFGKELKLNKQALSLIKNTFKKRKRKLLKINRKPAYLPKGSEVIINNMGTAPGFSYIFRKKRFYFLPGVPGEFRYMMKDSVLPELLKFADKTCTRSKLIKTFGLKESEVSLKLKKLNLGNDVILGYRSHYPEIHLIITTTGKQESETQKKLDTETKKLKKLLKDYIFGYDDELIEDTVGRLLKETKLKLSTAESCTGGLVSSRITDIPGSSEYFMMGLVSYSNESKINELKIPESIIKKYGAVSYKVADLMSRGIIKVSGTDLGIGITGIAGPAGGTKDKPVGTVHISLAFRNKIINSEKYFYNGSREQIKLITSTQALNMIRKFLLNYVYST